MGPPRKLRSPPNPGGWLMTTATRKAIDRSTTSRATSTRARSSHSTAVVTAELDGPEAALAAVDRLPLQDYHALHATRAELLRRAGRSAEA